MHGAVIGGSEPGVSSFDLPAASWAPRATVTRHQMEFNGLAGEYFRIWIVNVVLSILTLGLYSAWAKVRTHRYFYANTRLAGSSFEYLAQPIQILKGRLIAYAVAAALFLSSHFHVMWVFIPLFLLVMLLMPWLLYRTLRFRARYAAWRGLRFRFLESCSDAYVNFFFRPMLVPFSLYLAYPWMRMHQHDYIVSGHRFGGKRFGFADNLNGYIAPFAICVALGFCAFVAFSFLIGAITGISRSSHMAVTPGSATAIMLQVGPLLLFYAVFLILPVFLRTRYTNVMWQHANLGPHRFESTLRVRDIYALYLSNAVAIVVTLGLALPWAKIRMLRYRASKFVLLAGDDLEDFIAEAAEPVGAAGAELAGALDLDMDIDIGL